MINIRKIISYILAIILVILIVCTLLLSVLNIVIFSKSNVKNQIAKIDYYSEICNVITESSNNYIMQSGFDESIMDNTIGEEIINNDINNLIDAIYDEKEITISSDQIRKQLDENIEKFIQENDYNVSDENKKDIEKFEDKIEEIYIKNITYSKEVVEKVAKYFKMIKRILTIALVVIAIFTIILAIVIYKINRASLGISLLGAGIICIFTKFYSALNIAVNNILILNKAFSNFLINIINQIIQYIFVCGIILTVIGMILIIFLEIRTTKIQKRYEIKRLNP